MAYEDMREGRDNVIASLKDQLNQCEPLGLSLWVTIPMFTFVWALIAVYAGLRMLGTLIIGILLKPWKIFKAPFVAAWLWLDIIIITAWFLKRGAVKMSEEPK